MRNRLFLILLLLDSVHCYASQLVLSTNIPVADANSSREQVSCIMQQLQQPYQLLSMPWRRAKQEVKQHRIDGYFSAFPNADMDSHAQLSAPLFLENWYWFWHQRFKGPDSNSKIRYGAILGSHQADWLDSQQIQPEVQVNTIEQLLQLLAIGRIDIMLADLDQFKLTQQRLKLPEQQYRQQFFRYVPLGLYFSQHTLTDNPTLLAQFNDAIPLCAQAPFALSNSEYQHIVDLLHDDIATLSRHPMLQAAVTIQNDRPLLLSQLQILDKQWQQQQWSASSPMATAMLQTEASQLLQRWQAKYAGVITEVMVMNAQGANVAISKATSDYWQGDETKFLSVFGQPLAYFIDAVEYDASTQHFQVQFSVPITDEQQQHLGVLTVGIDVEKALSR